MCRDLGPAAAAKTASCQRDAMVYDLADNLLHATEDPAGLDLDTTYTYYEDDSLKTVTDPRGHTTETVYDERPARIADESLGPVDGLTGPTPCEDVCCARQPG